ncbi:MAG: hypothetical protein K2K74_05625 [Lachnospiraceae bacterium]|nr:hypothetical protein [Lachnospiraceae bacterium]
MKRASRILAMGLGLALTVSSTIFAAGNHNIQALKLNPYSASKGNDAMVFANGVKNNISSYSYKITDLTKGITVDDFYGKSDYIKYWASEGSYSGELWAKDSNYDVNAHFNLNDRKLEWAGGNLEFVFLAVCNQLNGSEGIKPRQIYAKAMRGNNAVRVISGYHDNAPSAADAAIANKFIEYAKTGESVKSSWILANEACKNDDSIQGYNARNYCVLTHSGNAQYSRIEGFPGSTYTRPGAGSTTILRFSAAKPNGATELTSADLADMEVPNYMLKGSLKDISFLSGNVIADVNDAKISTVMGEIGDTPVYMTSEEVKSSGLKWLDTNVKGLSSSTVENYEAEITPIVMSEIYDDDTEGAEQKIAYVVNYPNRFDGIRISGEGYDVVIGSEGVIAANVKWSDLEKIEYTAKESPVTYEQAKQLVERELGARSIQNIDEMKGDISFVYDMDSELYYPTWIFHLDDTTHTVNCLTGELK